MVYSDVCDLIDVGGSLARLLARFEIADRPGQQVGYVPQTIMYVPVASNSIGSILLELYDAFGELPPFASGNNCVVHATFHFRKRV